MSSVTIQPYSPPASPIKLPLESKRRAGRFTTPKSIQSERLKAKPPALSPKRSKGHLPGIPLSPSRRFTAPNSSPNRLSTTISALKLSPDTQKAAAKISLMGRGSALNRLRSSTRRLFEPAKCQAAPSPAKDSGPSTLKLILELASDPARADTRVYAEGSEGLSKKAQAIGKIKKAESMGLGLLSPFEGISVPGLEGFLTNRGISSPDYPRNCAKKAALAQRARAELGNTSAWESVNLEMDVDTTAKSEG